MTVREERSAASDVSVRRQPGSEGWPTSASESSAAGSGQCAVQPVRRLWRRCLPISRVKPSRGPFVGQADAFGDVISQILLLIIHEDHAGRPGSDLWRALER